LLEGTWIFIVHQNFQLMNSKTKFLAMAFALGAIFFSSEFASAQTTMEEFLSKWENGKQFAIEVVDKMPDHLMDYRPDPEAMSFKEQVTHFSSAIVGISKGFLNGTEPAFASDAKPQTKEELKAFIISCYDYGKATFTNLSEAELGEQIDSFAGKVTRRQMIGLIDDHVTHHRGAAISYIRANGIAPPPFRAI
jgi:uncharacterized damage-inducible protein DinB